jgi:hypothetical protein
VRIWRGCCSRVGSVQGRRFCSWIPSGLFGGLVVAYCSMDGDLEILLGCWYVRLHVLHGLGRSEKYSIAYGFG